ncbi:DUF1671-domain-containing protein [Cryphonectria parasitica EP155]|uniref:DUF1671-domain-containing protein n=1 Tax=Cryphonectria parasitica (strain ATCC 38755 / EP155) TaxID=660469 RepID=A0A9P5CHY6_CRYP1|nr:DUF1671-domain-containing protein [Cryphonectria parasitica EP155]KAF3760218.1 DUF1671-domain-containing protein [Cryphonectria parasitica EP155]
MECPFCGFKPPQGQEHEDYAMQLHIETEHSEGKSPFVPDESLSNPEHAAGNLDAASTAYVECPIEGCNEVVVRDELDYHLELHSDEADDGSATTHPESGAAPATDPTTAIGGDDVRRTRSAKRRRSPAARDISQDSEEVAAHSRRKKAIFAWRNILSMPKWNKSKPETDSGTTAAPSSSTVPDGPKQPKQLGKAELGRFAHEKKMPDWLVKMLKRDGQVVGQDVIPVLKQMLQQSESTEYAYLCHPCVQHVSKLRREGGSHNQFNGTLPSIFDIQEFIEAAWDRGINQQGRVETGGVRGTRKYIGTPEAQAMFRYLNVPCVAQGFKNKQEAGKAEASLLFNVEQYFAQGVYSPGDRVRCTMLPPIYFQHAGHSMTIVGIEKETNGKANLLVFDPMFRDAAVITQRIGRKFKYKYADSAIHAYRRGHKYLRRYREFECLR